MASPRATCRQYPAPHCHSSPRCSYPGSASRPLTSWDSKQLFQRQHCIAMVSCHRIHYINLESARINHSELSWRKFDHLLFNCREIHVLILLPDAVWYRSFFPSVSSFHIAFWPLIMCSLVLCRSNFSCAIRSFITPTVDRWPLVH